MGYGKHTVVKLLNIELYIISPNDWNSVSADMITTARKFLSKTKEWRSLAVDSNYIATPAIKTNPIEFICGYWKSRWFLRKFVQQRYKNKRTEISMIPNVALSCISINYDSDSIYGYSISPTTWTKLPPKLPKRLNDFGVDITKNQRYIIITAITIYSNDLLIILSPSSLIIPPLIHQTYALFVNS